MTDPTITCKLHTRSAITSPPYLIIGSSSVIGTSLIAPDIMYVDYMPYVRAFSTMRGTSQADQLNTRYEVGTASVTFNNLTRKFDPDANSDIVPDLPIQLSANWASTDYDLFTGVASTFKPAYPASARDSLTVASCNDGLARATDLTVRFRALSELTGARVKRYADLLDWDVGLRDIDAGVVLMPSGRPSVSALDGLLGAAVSELGEVFVQGDGTLRFRDQTAATGVTSSVATFGDAGSELKYSAAEPVPWDRSKIRNSITLTYNHQGDTVTASDGASIVTYGLHDDTFDASILNASDAQTIVDFLVPLFKDPVETFASITVNPKRDPTNLWPQVFGRELGDRITVKLTPPGGGSRISHDCFIRGIAHDVGNSPGSWVTTFYLSDASKWPT